jgi:hypothetical protein
MVEILKTLKDTPLPSILVIGGILFLLLSFVRKVGSNIELEPEKKWLVGFIGIILLCSGVGLSAIPAIQTPLSVAPTEMPIVETPTQAIPPTATILKPTVSISPTNTPAPSRCELIAQSLPQSKEAIASKFGIPVNSIFDVIHENCGGSIIDGFVYRSNQEGEWTVPDGGCIDAPPDAYFSDTTGSNGVGGSRAFSGIVRASAITYRMFCYR